MNSPKSEPERSNHDKLAGLAQPTSPAPSAPPPGVPPWENKPSDSRSSDAPPVADIARDTRGNMHPETTAPGPPTMAPASPAPPGLTAAGMPLAGIWNRAWGWFLDSIAGFVLSLIVVALILSPVFILAPDSPAGGILSFVGLIAGFITYFAASYRWWGRTPVMMIPRLYVIDQATGERLTWGRAYSRSVVLALAQSFGIIAIIWIAITSGNPLKQGPHDKAGRSLVVQRPR